MHFAHVCVCICVRMYVQVCITVCMCGCICIHERKLCVGRIQCKRKDEEYDEDDGRIHGEEEGRERGHRDGGGKRDGERERDVAKQRPSPISILIELNATSYLMPETRQKLQLNGDAISLYLPAHSS